MILNDYYSMVFLFLLALSMLAFMVLFALFIYKELGGVKFGRDSFLFFDYILFCPDKKANAAALSFFLIFIFGLVFNYKQKTSIIDILMDVDWLFGVILFFIHCRFFSCIKYEKKSILFFKELFWNLKVQLRYIILWLARILFIIVILYRFYQ